MAAQIAQIRAVLFIAAQIAQGQAKTDDLNSACISILLPSLPCQCYLNGPGNLGSNKEIQPQIHFGSTHIMV